MSSPLIGAHEDVRLALGDVINASNDLQLAALHFNDAGGNPQAILATLPQIRALIEPLLSRWENTAE